MAEKLSRAERTCVRRVRQPCKTIFSYSTLVRVDADSDVDMCLHVLTERENLGFCSTGVHANSDSKVDTYTLVYTKSKS